MTQTLHAHMNIIKKEKKKIKVFYRQNETSRDEIILELGWCLASDHS
jgi:CRISPR/Cas system CSM-associated protein Csm5 (group 7 of RAMP superfamily)